MPVKKEDIMELVDMDLWEDKIIYQTDHRKDTITRAPGGWILESVSATPAINDMAIVRNSTFIPLPDIPSGKF